MATGWGQKTPESLNKYLVDYGGRQNSTINFLLLGRGGGAGGRIGVKCSGKSQVDYKPKLEYLDVTTSGLDGEERKS